MFNNILVAFDGSDHAERALKIAADLAKTYKGDLSIAFVAEVPTTALAVGSGFVEIPVEDPHFKEHCDEMLTRAEGISKEIGQTGTAIALKGDAAQAILNKAQEMNADLLVVGRRGMGMLRGLVMGSVSQKLTAHAHCPVLTVE